ncbi:MAG: hypothetical protein IIX89_00070 [Oscillospiraceae bacterium]|nr:hypothetical protein [Oscillospiraceae bacterium]
MKSDKILGAIGSIGDDLIENAQKPRLKAKKGRKKWLIPSVAAALVLVIGATLFFSPDKTPIDISAKAGVIAKAQYPEQIKYPGDNADEAAYTAWYDQQRELTQKYNKTADLKHFLSSSIPEFLSNAGEENLVYSPLNVYMALSMLTEVTDGQSRAQILDLLGYKDINALRKEANYIWNACYNDDGTYSSILASSMWLRNDLKYKEKTLKSLAERYFASSYRGEMGTAEYNKAIADWLNEQTGNLLKDQIGDIRTESDTVMMLATTLYFSAKWSEWFREEDNTQDIFKSKSGDITCEFMNQTLLDSFYVGENFSAARINFNNNQGEMWFMLPDEDVDVTKLASDKDALKFISTNGKDGAEEIRDSRINISVPKFDVSSQIQMMDGLKNLGVTDIFDFAASDFSPLTSDTDVIVSQALHGARVKIDEEGCTAAAYTVITMTGGAVSLGKEFDFVLDRPFMFVITSPNGLPLFTGIVNTPN